MPQLIDIERRDRVASVTLRVPERRNALSIALMHELIDFARACEVDYAIDAVVVSGGAHWFSAGNDLKDEARWDTADRSFVEQRDIAATGFRLCKAWEEIPQITIAAVEGFAIGGGFAFALACDWRVLGESAHLRLPESSLGFPLTWGTIPRITALVGPAAAKRLVILGEQVSAARALELGLADYLAADRAVLARALELALEVTRIPPAAARMGKEAINALAGMFTRVASHASADQFTLAAASETSMQARARALKR